jgi:hypothetical protein
VIGVGWEPYGRVGIVCSSHVKWPHNRYTLAGQTPAAAGLTPDSFRADVA